MNFLGSSPRKSSSASAISNDIKNSNRNSLVDAINSLTPKRKPPINDGAKLAYTSTRSTLSAPSTPTIKKTNSGMKSSQIDVSKNTKSPKLSNSMLNTQSSNVGMRDRCEILAKTIAEKEMELKSLDELEELVIIKLVIIILLNLVCICVLFLKQ